MVEPVGFDARARGAEWARADVDAGDAIDARADRRDVGDAGGETRDGAGGGVVAFAAADGSAELRAHAARLAVEAAARAKPV